MINAKLENVIEQIATRDVRYSPQAYFFVLETLDFINEHLAEDEYAVSERHVSVYELLAGARHYALGQYGPLSRIVLEDFGLHGTEDIGEVVFNMVEADVLNKQEEDNRGDFVGGFDFREVFENEYSPALPW